MGFLKSMKDLNGAVKAAPGMSDQAQALGAQAQQMGLAQQQAAEAQAQLAAASASAAGVPNSNPGQLDPIAGVSLQQFAAVSRGLAAHGYDVEKAPMVALEHGIPGHDWATASAGWNGRITADPAVAKAFNTAYRAI